MSIVSFNISEQNIFEKNTQINLFKFTVGIYPTYLFLWSQLKQCWFGELLRRESRWTTAVQGLTIMTTFIVVKDSYFHFLDITQQPAFITFQPLELAMDIQICRKFLKKVLLGFRGPQNRCFQRSLKTYFLIYH